MREEARELLEEEGIAENTTSLTNYIDLRYKGQWRSLAVLVSDQITSLDTILEAFHQEHEREFAFSDKDQAVEIFGLRVTAIGTVPKPNFPQYVPESSLKLLLKKHALFILRVNILKQSYIIAIKYPFIHNLLVQLLSIS